MMRRVYWSITTSTQKVRKAHRLTSEQIVDTPWKIVFRFIERLLQSRKSFKSFQAFSERLGISKDCVDLPNGELTLPILETVVRRPTPFVVLVREGIVQGIADRAALATRMAVGA